MNKYTIFIVEDDPWYSQILQYHLSLNPDYEVTLFSSGQECLSKMSLKPDLITLDFLLPDLRGDKIYKKIREVNPNVPVIMISSQEDIAVAVKLLKMGVSDYIIKDEATKDLLWNSIIRIRETQNLKKEVAYLKEELGQKYSFENTIIGKSDSIKRIYGMMGKAIKTNINISITGETGTGKELVAKAIHYNSSRNKKNFIAVNMAAIPFELIESDLFGHERGAFTGAIKQKIGKFEEANGGTLFLDEIAELNLSIQAKLLRVLQEREFVRVGGNKNIKLDVRLIIATHKDLAEEVRKGTFREDLFLRVMGLPIKLPPLRERSEDILILAKYFVDDFAKENNMGIIHFAQEAKTKLLHYYFPGNVRELKAIIDLAAVLCENNKITANDITFTTSKNKEVFMNEQKTLKQYTREIIKYYLKKNNNDVIAAAKDLDIGKSTIYKMLKNGELDSD